MTIHKWLVGFVLAVVMLLVLVMNIILFSARDFQFGLAQISPETNGLISVERLLEVDEQVTRITDETAEPRGELLQIRSQIETVDAAIAGDQAQLIAQRAAIAGGIAEVESALQTSTAQSAAADLDVLALTGRIQGLAAQTGMAPEAQEKVATLQGDVQSLAELELALGARDTERAQLSARERLIGGQVAESDRRIFALQQSVVPNYEHYQRVKSEVMALLNMSPLGIGAMAAQGHPAFVSTLLVLLMGALGATLYLFPAYLNRVEPVTFAEIVVRLIFGMVAAMAFYMMTNAAVFGISFGSGVEQVQTSSALSPFTVAVIGVIAGVMAEDIAKWVQDRGKGIFTQGVQTKTKDGLASTDSDAGFTGPNPHGGPLAP